MEEIAEDRLGNGYCKPQSQMLGESIIEQMFKAYLPHVTFKDVTPNPSRDSVG